jgi:hypothetical protein
VNAAAVTASARRDRVVNDALFVAQLGCAIGFGITQGVTMLSSVAGISITWFALWFAFLLVNLALATSALRRRPDRFMRQTVVVYTTWAIAIAANLIMLLVADSSWSVVDTVTLAITGVGIVASVVVARARQMAVSDAMVRASFAVFLKSVPQITLAWNILRDGGDGIALFAIIAGHLIITMRLAQIGFSIRISGWDRERFGLAIGEGANEATWIVVTMVWLVAA